MNLLCCCIIIPISVQQIIIVIIIDVVNAYAAVGVTSQWHSAKLHIYAPAKAFDLVVQSRQSRYLHKII